MPVNGISKLKILKIIILSGLGAFFVRKSFMWYHSDSFFTPPVDLGIGIACLVFAWLVYRKWEKETN